MNINTCKRSDLHNHSAQEEGAVRAMCEHWGGEHADAFIATHCDPQSRYRFEEQWRQQPEGDFESFGRQLDLLVAAEEVEEGDAWLKSQAETGGAWFVEKERAAAQSSGSTLREFRKQRWGSTEWRQTVKGLAEANASGRIGPRVLALLESVGHRDWEVVNEGVIR